MVSQLHTLVILQLAAHLFNFRQQCASGTFPMPTHLVTRRAFLHRVSRASLAGLAFPAILRSQGGQTPNNRLNIAYVGVGGRGRNAVLELQDENRVAFCDVDDMRAAVTYEKFPDVPRFRDFRQMLDKLGNQIEAVRISTP